MDTISPPNHVGESDPATPYAARRQAGVIGRTSQLSGTVAPISCSSLRALIASLPIRRWTILPLKAGEKGFVTASSHPRPGGSGIEEGDNPGAGGRLDLWGAHR